MFVINCKSSRTNQISLVSLSEVINTNFRKSIIISILAGHNLILVCKTSRCNYNQVCITNDSIASLVSDTQIVTFPCFFSPHTSGAEEIVNSIEVFCCTKVRKVTLSGIHFTISILYFRMHYALSSAI